jgi:antitoxin ParD1/3/4
MFELAIFAKMKAMPTRNVNLTDELDRFVRSKIKTGRYENASEVIRAALRALEREEQHHRARLRALGAAIKEGQASGIAEGNPFKRLRGKIAAAGIPLLSDDELRQEIRERRGIQSESDR